MNEQAMKLLDDPEAIWEAISVDGVKYDNNELKGEAAAIYEYEYDNERALAIGNMVKLALEENTPSGDTWKGRAADACLGAMVRNQITKHLEAIAEQES